MRFENQTFTTDVTWDFNTFVNCTFAKGCTIWFHGFDHSVIDSRIEGARFMVGGPASLTLVFLKTLRQSNPQLVEDMINNAGNAAAAPPGTRSN